jgi:uncharacterized damage-inducible protein DinB
MSEGPLADLARRWSFAERLLDAETQGFTSADWDAPASERGGNAARWILAHVTHYRRRFCRQLGEPVPDDPWERTVARGSKTPAVAALPAPEELRAAFRAAGEAIAQRLAALTEAQTRADLGETYPDGGRTVADAAHFLHFHETYHLGQIGLIRRLRGRPGFA